MLNSNQRRQTRFCSRKTNTALWLLSATLLLSGCAISNPQVIEPQRAIPKQLCERELQIWKNWSESFLKLLQNATLDGNDARQNLTR